MSRRVQRQSHLKIPPLPIEFSNLHRVFDEAVIMAVTDLDGKIIWVNDRFCQISQRFREELLGQDHRIVNSKYHPKEFFRNLWETIQSGRVWRGEIRNRAKDGSLYWVDTTIIPALDEKGKPYQYMAFHYEITEKKKIEEALKELPQRIIQAHEEERKLIAQDIHDDFGQLLIALKIFLVHKTADLSGKYPQIKVVADELKSRINTIIDKARDLSHELVPPTLKYIGLTKAVKELIESEDFGESLSIKFLHDNFKDVKLEKKDIIIYRIIQEALTNVIKHARATQVEIRMRLKSGKMDLTIKDNGQGFELKVPGKFPSGLGLSVMRERAKMMDGVFQIRSSPGAGTRIHLSVPVY